MIEGIYRAHLRLDIPDYKERFAKYIEERGVPADVSSVASAVLEQLTAGRSTISFSIGPKKEVMIVASPLLQIYTRISREFCELSYVSSGEHLVSQLPLAEFNPDVFIDDLAQAYSLARPNRVIKEENLYEDSRNSKS